MLFIYPSICPGIISGEQGYMVTIAKAYKWEVYIKKENMLQQMCLSSLVISKCKLKINCEVTPVQYTKISVGEG